jgi:hypothetical protein
VLAKGRAFELTRTDDARQGAAWQRRSQPQAKRDGRP